MEAIHNVTGQPAFSRSKRSFPGSWAASGRVPSAKKASTSKLRGLDLSKSPRPASPTQVKLECFVGYVSSPGKALPIKLEFLGNSDTAFDCSEQVNTAHSVSLPNHPFSYATSAATQSSPDGFGDIWDKPCRSEGLQNTANRSFWTGSQLPFFFDDLDAYPSLAGSCSSLDLQKPPCPTPSESVPTTQVVDDKHMPVGNTSPPILLDPLPAPAQLPSQDYLPSCPPNQNLSSFPALPDSSIPLNLHPFYSRLATQICTDANSTTPAGFDPVPQPEQFSGELLYPNPYQEFEQILLVSGPQPKNTMGNMTLRELPFAGENADIPNDEKPGKSRIGSEVHEIPNTTTHAGNSLALAVRANPNPAGDYHTEELQEFTFQPFYDHFQPGPANLRNYDSIARLSETEQQYSPLEARLGKEDASEQAVKKGRKPRAPLADKKRLETSKTRDMGACVRCKIQRIRCNFDPDDPEGPCLTCQKVRRNQSKKVIHHIGCQRYKLQEITLFRTCSLGYQRRWEGSQVRDIPSREEGEVFVIMDQGLCDVPLGFRIRPLREPRPGDELSKVGPNGEPEIRHELAQYVLVNVQAVREAYVEYINKNARDTIWRTMVEGFTEEEVVKDVWGELWKHLRSLESRVQSAAGKDEGERDAKLSLEERNKLEEHRRQEEQEMDFLSNLFKLWFAMREATGTSRILPVNEGSEYRGYSASRLHRVSQNWLWAPRLPVDQFNSINITFVLKPLSKDLVKTLMDWISKKKWDRFLAIFFGCFVLLREIAYTTDDAYVHGFRRAGTDTPRFASVVRDMQESANVILAHWHYFMCSTDPTSLKSSRRQKTPLKYLTEDQLNMVTRLWTGMRAWKGSSPACTMNDVWAAQNWRHPLYFVAQMFEENWVPKKTFLG